jgi:hypothetical protein
MPRYRSRSSARVAEGKQETQCLPLLCQIPSWGPIQAAVLITNVHAPESVSIRGGPKAQPQLKISLNRAAIVAASKPGRYNSKSYKPRV